MINKKPKTLFIDIETSPCIAGVFQTGNQYVSEGQILEHTKIICICAKWADNHKIYKFIWSNKDDYKLLKRFRKFADKADVIIGHNEKKFDIPTINVRLCDMGLMPLPLWTLDDTFRQCINAFKLPSYKLAYLARYFKLGYKMRTDGWGLWFDVLNGNKERLNYMVDYCAMDTRLVEKLYNKIKPYVKSDFNKAAYALDDTICPSCGESSLFKDGFRTTLSGKYQRLRCTSCGKSCRSGKNLIMNSNYLPRG